jgi:MFS family permease
MGVLYLIGVIPVALIWLRPDPTAMGLSIDGERAGPIIQILGAAENLGSSVDKKVDVSLDGLTFKQARSGRFFWGVASGYIFLMMAQVGGIAHQFGLAREQLTESQTAIAIAILPVASIVGRLIGGWIVDQMSIRAFAIFMMVLQGLSLSLLATGVNAVTLCLGLGLFGVTVGNLLMLQPLLIAEAFGVRDYARIFSVANLLSSWGTAAGPAVLGFVYAMNQNLYSLPYTVAAMAAALGLLLFLAGGKLHG